MIARQHQCGRVQGVAACIDPTIDSCSRQRCARKAQVIAIYADTMHMLQWGDYLQILHGEHPMGHKLTPDAGSVYSIEMNTNDGPAAIFILKIEPQQVRVLVGIMNDGDWALDCLKDQIQHTWPDTPIIFDGARIEQRQTIFDPTAEVRHARDI